MKEFIKGSKCVWESLENPMIWPLTPLSVCEFGLCDWALLLVHLLFNAALHNHHYITKRYRTNNNKSMLFCLRSDGVGSSSLRSQTIHSDMFMPSKLQTHNAVTHVPFQLSFLVFLSPVTTCQVSSLVYQQVFVNRKGVLTRKQLLPFTVDKPVSRCIKKIQSLNFHWTGWLSHVYVCDYVWSTIRRGVFVTRMTTLYWERTEGKRECG